MRLEAISLEHMNAFIQMMHDYASQDPQALALEFPSLRAWDAGVFREYVNRCERERLDWKPGPGKTSLSRYVLLDHQAIIGHALLRFPLDESSSVEGGNVSFSSPPSFRGGLNEVYTLNKMLFEAVRAGLARILVTCAEDDVMRRQAIEMNRGEYENTVLSPSGIRVRRYWIHFR